MDYILSALDYINNLLLQLGFKSDYEATTGVTDYPCPTCDRDFDTRRGLGVHHVHAHNERLPNRDCDYCGVELYSDYAKKYCSENCLQNSNSYAGPNNPNYRDALTETSCEICGAEFEYYPSEKPGLYCPDCVSSKNWQTPPDIEGSANPRWAGGKTQRDCVMCGNPVKRHPSGFPSDVTLCGRKCHQAWLSEAFSGEGHPNWKGGGNEAYGRGWGRVRALALERDRYACVVCGASKAEIGRNPDVHHIVPVRVFIAADRVAREEAHRLENVVSLCVPCHRRADFGVIGRDELWSAIGVTGGED